MKIYIQGLSDLKMTSVDNPGGKLDSYISRQE